MANGTDSEEFVLLSGPRTGLKREFSFAVKVQSELSGSLGRTRSRKFQNSPSSNGVLENLSNKRLKSSCAKKEPKNDVEKVPTEEEAQNDSAKSPSGEEPKSDLAKSTSEEELKSGALKSSSAEDPKNHRAKSPREEGSGEKTGVMIGDNSEVPNALPKKPLRRLTRSASKLNAERMVTNDNSEVRNDSVKSSSMEELESNLAKLTREEPKNDFLKSLSSEDPKNNVAKSPREEGTNVETPILIDDTINEQNALLEKPLRRFTRSALKHKVEPVVLADNSKVQNALPEKPLTRFSSALEPKGEPMVVDDNSKVQNVWVKCPSKKEPKGDLAKPTSEEEQKIHSLKSPSGEEPMNNGAKSPREEDTNVETPIVIDKNSEVQNHSTSKPKAESIDNNSEVHNTIPEKALRRFTRSALKPKVEPMVIDENSEVQNSLPDTPLRRFTRSALKPKAERMEILAMTTTSGNSIVSEDACKNEAIAKGDGRATNVVSSFRTPPKQKLEMKMSKKIAVTKFPAKVKELFETGMLEGLHVKYIFRGKKKGGLQGTIKNRGILCSCSLCKGCKVVTPFQFEQHAGSTNKHPADHICLENGNSLREVLNACKDATLDTLETTIQRAICSTPIKNATICSNCKGPLPALFTKRRMLLCNSCLESEKSQANPAHATGADARLSKSVVTPKSLDGAPNCISPQNKSSQGKLTRKDLRLHKLVFEEDGLPDGTELAYYVRGQKLLEGYKKGFGIFCRCCNSEVSPSQFEAHAGWASRRKPYLHIYTSNGVSLHELSLSLSKGRKFSANDNDDLCSICADFGDLLLCDGCPRAFHKDCVGQASIPRGDWYCPYCQDMFQRDKSCANNANAKAAGRVSGVDPIEQISKRCIRIVKTPEIEVGGCTLCRRNGFSKSGFGPRTVLLCDQCEKEFHVGCLKDHKMGDLKELPKGKWFCCTGCSRIHSALQKLLVCGSEKLPDSLSNVIKKKSVEKCSNSDADLDVRWRLLSGKTASPESRSLLSRAVAIFHDCFDPIIDSTTGRDLIPSMVYGRNLRDQEFGGMYCAVLTVSSSVVSAGILRIFGQEVAELPLVATSSDYQGQGYFQSLFSCIERLLASLNVRNLVLPAADEAESIWTQKFGFNKISNEQLSKYRKDCQMMTFQGTSMLQKPVPECQIVGKSTEER